MAWLDARPSAGRRRASPGRPRAVKWRRGARPVFWSAGATWLSTLSPHRPSAGRPLVLRVDVALVLTTLVVAAIGVVIVYSATRSKLAARRAQPPLLPEPAGGLRRGGRRLVMVVLAALDYRWLEHASAVLYVGIDPGPAGHVHADRVERARAPPGGSRSGPIQIQPSAFAIPVLIVTVATFCARRPEGLGAQRPAQGPGPGGRAHPAGGEAARPGQRHRDVPSCCSSCWWWPASPTATSSCSWSCCRRRGLRRRAPGLLKAYQLNRLTSVPPPGKNLQSTRYNLDQSVAAIGSGGIVGQGLFHGPQTNLAYVPEQQTDFIFSAVGEQLGFVGSASVLAAARASCRGGCCARPDVARRLRPAPGRGLLHLHRLQRLRERRDGDGDHAGGRHPAAVPELRGVGHRRLLLRRRHRPVGAVATPSDDRRRAPARRPR